jgi:hypothetical protein
MRINARLAVLLLVLPGLSACGGSSNSGGGSTPTSPTTTTPTNRAPVIATMTASPAFGVQQLSQFSFTASATDADNDALTYTWDFGDGTQGTGTSTTKTYATGGTMSVRLSVSDGKAAQGIAPATTTDTRSIVVGSMTGQWSGTIDLDFCIPGRIKPVTATLTQSSGTVTGSIYLPEGLCSFSPGTAVTDPAEPGTINAAGAFQVRAKVPPYTDVYFRGTMDATGRRITGGIYNSGHNGTPFVWNKQ